ncbi:hypothetical protein ABZ863_29855 [Saccharomonospora sp. NPDC046836]|uniref:hypothetical protein n=1 Tax=Saccharomonospora sp. NPDC046836 TaxID=3156921 RepID=UPI003410FC81
MSTYQVMKLLRDWAHDPAAAQRARAATIDDLTDDYGLNADEAKAIVDRRLDLLSELGVHPVSLVQFARAFQFSLVDRWEELGRREPENRRSER